jgi:cytochrome c oxidase assembly protein subunit 15
MSDSPYSPWLHRLALLAACTALFTIAVGTVVTTKKAGMAFPDWPTSDGYGIFTYPWWQSAGDKFLEHGHRLAGIAIGIASLVLCVALLWREQRRWVKSLGGVVLVAVVLQGILGGFRVRLNAEDLALIHGSGAAFVFALTVGVAVVTSRRWREPTTVGVSDSLARLQILSIATTICVLLQYVLGGFLRHKGMLLFEHLGFAFAAALMMIWLAMSVAASRNAWLRGLAAILAVLTIVQLALGAAAWITKFGFEGEVAVRGSTSAVAVSSMHVVTGALLVGTCVALATRVARLQWLMNRPADRRTISNPFGVPLPLAGGAP